MKRQKWVRYHPKPTTKPPEYREPNTQKTMKCWNEFWVAKALWRRRDGIWMCVEADKIINWMVGMDPSFAKLNLARRGCDWNWAPT